MRQISDKLLFHTNENLRLFFSVIFFFEFTFFFYLLYFNH